MHKNVGYQLLDVNANFQKSNANPINVNVRKTVLAVWQKVGNVMVKTRGGTDIRIRIIIRICICKSIYIYIPWPFPPVWGVADNTKEQQKQWGPHSVPLAMTRDPAEFGWHCWSNTAHPPPSSTIYVASQMPSPLLPLP